MNKNIEVEGGEIAIRNSHGDLAIIPKDKRDWVKQKLSEGCHSCIDSLVETLPVMEDYASDGSIMPNDNEDNFKYKSYTAAQDNTYVASRVVKEQNKKQQFVPRERPVLKADTRTDQERGIAQKYTEAVLNPSISTQIGETLQKPLRWLSDPVKGVGDIVSAIAPNSSLAKDLPNTHADTFEHRKKQLNPYTSNREKISNTINEAVPLTNMALLNILPVEAAAGNIVKSGKNLIKPVSKVVGKTDDAIKAGSKVLSKTDNAVKPIVSSVDNVSKQVTKSAWKMEELPGLHLKSTMGNNPKGLHTQVAKDGSINTENALKFIKNNEGEEKYNLIRQAFGETLPNKMNYNEFRKVVQDQLIPLEKQFSEHASNYGIGKLGYPSPKRSSYEAAITHANVEKEKQLQIIKEYEGYLKNPNKYKKAFSYDSILSKTNDELLPQIKSTLDDYKQRLVDTERQISQSMEEMKLLPLENQTLILGNKGKFGRGSSAHGNPEETLGHIHFLRDAETPDVLTVTQIQSDAFQGTHRIMPKNTPSATALERQQKSLQRMEELQERNKSVLNKMKSEGVDEAGLPVQEYQIKQFEDIVKAQEQSNLFKKADIENFTQKQLLDKNHQERYLQELVDYAGKRGDVNKVRVPTSETAAKVQGYIKEVNPLYPEAKTKILNLEAEIKKHNDFFEGNFNHPKYKEKADKLASELEAAKKQEIDSKEGYYSSEHQTILKKYSEQPKTIKKLFGEEPKIVTDSKGNTWYEFDIPKKFKEGKGEIKVFGLIPPAIGIGAAIQSQNQNKTEQ